MTLKGYPIVRVVLTLLLVVTACFGVRGATGYGGDAAAAASVGWVYMPVKGLLALVLAAAAMRPRPERAAWALLALGVAGSFAGDFVWNTVLADDGTVPVPSAADVLYVASYVPMFASAVLFTRGRLHGLRSGLWLDGLLSSLAVATVFAAVVLAPIRRSLEDAETWVLITQLAYPVADLLLLAAFVAGCALRDWRLDARWLILCAGAGIYVLADSLYLLRLLDETYTVGGALDAGWLLAAGLWAYAGWTAPANSVSDVRAWRASVAVPVMFGLAATLAFAYEAMDADSDAIVTALGFATILTVFARFVLSSRDNFRLLTASRHEATTDALTGLGNRRKLNADLAVLGPEPHALVIFDLDGFKGYNDTFGHPAGDALLRFIGDALASAVDARGSSYRMGGDEFCALVPCRDLDAEAIGRQLADQIAQSGKGFSIGASQGTVVIPAEASTAEEALRLADRRLYACKHQGRASADRQSADVLLAVLAERDPDLGEHVGHVASMAERVARHLGLPAEEVLDVRRAAELHDIGKVAVPDSIINKPAPLDDDEMELMRQHTVVGERVLSAAPALARVGALVRSSHERWDGSGYPDRRAGHDIPLGARIVFVCDAYDAMTADRPYRAGVPSKAALAELERCAGTQFDPLVVRAFKAVLGARSGEPAAVATPASAGF